MRDLPHKLNINEDFEITEALTLDGVERILLSPSECYLNDDVVQLEEVIKEIVKRYNEKRMLFQMHHQSKADGTTEFVAQNEVECMEEMRAWQSDVAKRNPLPEGCQWFICNEKDLHFVKVVAP